MIKMASEIEQKIIKQIEYYFGDINLPRDKFLQEKIKEDEGWVPLEIMLKFKRLASISDDEKVIADAVEKSETKLVVLSEDRKKVRRNPDVPIPEMNEERRKKLMERSAYAKGFPLDEQLNDIINFMEPYGPIESVIRRTDKNHKFKGSCFIVFKDVELAKKFVELENVKYKETELIRKMQNDYHAFKKQQIEERKKTKKEKKEKKAEEEAEKIQFPKGIVIHFSGIEEGKDLTREEIKEKVKEVGEFEVSYVDYNKGDSEGYVRFPKEDNAVEFSKKLTDGELEIGDNKLKVRVLEGTEEEEYLKKTSNAMIKMRQKPRSFRKRKGNFGGGARNAKQKKTNSDKD